MATPAFTKKEVDIEALMAQAAALEAEEKEKAQVKSKPKKEKVKKEKPPKEKKPRVKKERTKSTPKKEKPKEKKEKKSKKTKKGPVKARKIFGLDVKDLELEDNELPELFVTLISALESHATETQGLFRQTAAKSAVDALVNRFEEGEDLDWNNYEDKHLVGGVLMEFLLRMPEPLVTFDAYHRLIAAFSSDEDKSVKLAKCRDILKSLPELNFAMLDYLFDFLDTMTRDSDDNLMTAENLAICFGPGLMRRLEDDLALIMKDTPFITSLITNFIEQYGFFFRGESIDSGDSGSNTMNMNSTDYGAFVNVARNGLKDLSKRVSELVSELEWEKLWKPSGLAHLFVAEDMLSKLIKDEIGKLTADDINNEISECFDEYLKDVNKEGTEAVCTKLRTAFHKHYTSIEDTIVVLNQQSNERDLVLQACKLSNSGKLLMDTIQPNIKQEFSVSSDDISQVQESVPKIKTLLDQMKTSLDTCTNYSVAVLISRVVRGIQKGLKEKIKTPVSEVDLVVPASVPSAKDKMKIQSLQDALEFSFPACTKVLNTILAATKDPEKKSEAIRDADLLNEILNLLEKSSKEIKSLSSGSANAPPPVAPHPKSSTPPPVAPHPKAQTGGAPPPVVPHPKSSTQSAPPPIVPHPKSQQPAKANAPPPVAPHPRAQQPTKGSAPPPVAPHPRAQQPSKGAPPPLAPHPKSGAPPPIAPHPRGGR